MTIRIQDLYTFHVIARTGAMQDAARELGVTPGAISQRIRAVEERYGLRLFTRSKKGIALTRAGLALQSDVSTAFSMIETAHTEHFTAQSNTIRISTSMTLAHSFLVSSLGRFADAYPAIKISIEINERLVDLKSEPIDLAIRHGLGTYSGMASQWLCSPELVLVASPELLKKQKQLKEPADCLDHKLLPDSTGKDWPLWFEAHGIDAKGAIYATQYPNDFLTVKAAIEGQGLALLNDIYVKESLESGQLVRVLNTAWPTAFAYYAVGLDEALEKPSISVFVKWLKKDLA